MNLAIVTLVAFVALGSALPSHRLPTNRGLKEDFDKFVDLLPKAQIMAIAMDYLANDAEVQETVEYLQSGDFKSLITDIETIAEYRKFLNYLQSNGLNVYYYINKLHELLGLPEFVPSRVHFRRGTGVRGLIDDIKAILPVDQIKALYYETLETSAAFTNLVDILKGDEFKGIVKELRANPKYQELIQRARDHGVDIEHIIELLQKMFGWDFDRKVVVSTRGLKEDFDKFFALLPKDQILAIAMDYLANDAEVQEAVEYLQSGDFKSIITDIETIQEYRKFLNYLQSNGLNVYYYINKLHELLGLPEFVPSRVQFRRGTGVRGLIDDIKAILPVDQIKALYYETLETSAAFTNLVDVLKGDEFKGIVKELRANPKYQELIQRARDHGVDIQHIIELLQKMFGWDFGRRSVY